MVDWVPESNRPRVFCAASLRGGFRTPLQRRSFPAVSDPPAMAGTTGDSLSLPSDSLLATIPSFTSIWLPDAVSARGGSGWMSPAGARQADQADRRPGNVVTEGGCRRPGTPNPERHNEKRPGKIPGARVQVWRQLALFDGVRAIGLLVSKSCRLVYLVVRIRQNLERAEQLALDLLVSGRDGLVDRLVIPIHPDRHSADGARLFP